jgi:hypothetical protein
MTMRLGIADHFGWAVAATASADHRVMGPRATLGPPWTKDHRTALAATIICS